MKTYPTFQQVGADLGDNVLDAISRATMLTREDLSLYREKLPAFVAQHTERGLAAWIHDRFRYHFNYLLDGVEDISVRDKEPTREMFVGSKYRMRVKRHHPDGSVSSYDTQTFLEFVEQPAQTQFEGMEEVRLIAGYEWNADARNIADAILSIRDGKNNIIWCEALPPPGDDDLNGTIRPSTPTPTSPTVDTSFLKRENEENAPE